MRTLCGALLWSLFLLLALVLHGRAEQKRLAEYKALCHLVAHIKSTLLQAPVPLPTVYAEFSDGALEGSTFLSVLRERGLSSALREGGLSLDGEELTPFTEYAEALEQKPPLKAATVYAEELAAADALLARVTSLLSQKEAALPVRRRLTGTLFFSGGMLLLLLLL